MEDLIDLFRKIDLLDMKKYLNRFVAAKADTDLLALTTIHEIYLLLLAGLEQPTPTQVAEVLHVSKPAVTSMIGKLERLELIQKVRSKEDKRTYIIELGPKGERLYRIDQEYNDLIFSRIWERLSKEEQRVWRKILNIVVEVMEELD